MTPRLAATPLAAALAGDLDAAWAAQSARRMPAPAATSLMAEGAARANRDRLVAGEALAVTTGQQAGLFTGPLYAVFKALSAAALAAELSARRGRPVVPLFWVAGDDHDFAEINHCAVIGLDGRLTTVTLRDRAEGAAMLPAYREPVGAEGAAALAELEQALPPGTFRDDALAWLRRAWTPDRSLADANARAMAELLAPWGVVVCQGWDAGLKQAAAPVVEAALAGAADLDTALLSQAERLRERGDGVPVTVGDGMALVMIEGRDGRDRLRIEGGGRFATRRSGESWDLAGLGRLLASDPVRVSANVLLRPAVEAAVFPTVAYVGGPGEMAYLEQTGPVFTALGVPRPVRVPRFSAAIVETKVDAILARYALGPGDLARPESELATALARAEVPRAAMDALAALRAAFESRYADVIEQAAALDPTLRRSVEGSRNLALAGARKVEKKLVAATRRRNDTRLRQVLRARDQLYPGGAPQERTVSVASFLARHGRDLLAQVFDAARDHAGRHLEAAVGRP